MRQFRSGDVVTQASLVKAYGPLVTSVCSKSLEMIPRIRGRQQTYKVTESLPTKERYEELQNEVYSISVANLLEDAFSEAEVLFDETVQAYDNMPDGHQYTVVGERLNKANDVLKTVSRLDELEPDVETQHLVYVPKSLKSPDENSERVLWIADMLEAAGQVVQKYAEQLMAKKEGWESAASAAENLEEMVLALRGADIPEKDEIPVKTAE